MSQGFNLKLYMELFKRCPTNQLRQLRKLEAKNKGYIDKINALPKGLPKIDWAFYRKNVRPNCISMVDDFEEKYKNFEVPIPTETACDEIEKETKKVEKMVEEYIEERCASIADIEDKIEECKAKVPYEEMTWEDYIDSYPNDSPNFIKRPTFWPHFPDEQEVGPPKNAKSDH